MIAAFIETPIGGEELNELFGGSSDDYLNAKKDWQVKLEGGSIIPIFPGDKVAPFTPSRPNSAYGSFVENLLRHIGTGLNIPYELLLKDFSKTNYSSARSAFWRRGGILTDGGNGWRIIGQRLFMNCGLKKWSIRVWWTLLIFMRTATLTPVANGLDRGAVGLIPSKRRKPANFAWRLGFQPLKTSAPRKVLIGRKSSNNE